MPRPQPQVWWVSSGLDASTRGDRVSRERTWCPGQKERTACQQTKWRRQAQGRPGMERGPGTGLALSIPAGIPAFVTCRGPSRQGRSGRAQERDDKDWETMSPCHHPGNTAVSHLPLRPGEAAEEHYGHPTLTASDHHSGGVSLLPRGSASHAIALAGGRGSPRPPHCAGG